MGIRRDRSPGRGDACDSQAVFTLSAICHEAGKGVVSMKTTPKSAKWDAGTQSLITQGRSVKRLEHLVRDDSRGLNEFIDDEVQAHRANAKMAIRSLERFP
jgi:hypothetical protein